MLLWVQPTTIWAEWKNKWKLKWTRANNPWRKVICLWILLIKMLLRSLRRLFMINKSRRPPSETKSRFSIRKLTKDKLKMLINLKRSILTLIQRCHQTTLPNNNVISLNIPHKHSHKDHNHSRSTYSKWGRDPLAIRGHKITRSNRRGFRIWVMLRRRLCSRSWCPKTGTKSAKRLMQVT